MKVAVLTLVAPKVVVWCGPVVLVVSVVPTVPDTFNAPAAVSEVAPLLSRLTVKGGGVPERDGIAVGTHRTADLLSPAAIAYSATPLIAVGLLAPLVERRLPASIAVANATCSKPAQVW